ncbi:MAG TPA: helix-turn-helix transcriptional regulator [Polyangiales bacterium]
MAAAKSPHAHGRSEIWARKPLKKAIERRITALGARLRAVRKELRLSQEQAAELCGLHPKYVQRIEAGKANPTLASVTALAHAYGVELRDLF